uniref:(northern house mosquito) hypothetical protein n=1 Tax=Culex pipiens TaxID=7175 RepID=A0A8D8I091_CULPI
MPLQNPQLLAGMHVYMPKCRTQNRHPPPASEKFRLIEVCGAVPRPRVHSWYDTSPRPQNRRGLTHSQPHLAYDEMSVILAGPGSGGQTEQLSTGGCEPRLEVFINS